MITFGNRRGIMVQRLVISMALTVLACASVAAAEPENPFKKVEKGQWVSYHLNLTVNGNQQSGEVKHRVTAVGDNSVTFETTSTVNGNQTPAQSQVIDLTKPYDLLGVANFPSGKDTKVEKKDNGKESLEIGGKKYECEWTRYAVTVGNNGMKTTVEIKIWICKDVPLHGLVKMDINSEPFKVKMEIDKTGKD
jgi:hypothetical protein